MDDTALGLSDLGKRLKSPPKSKDALIKLLTELVEALANIGHGFKDLDSIKLPLVQPVIIHNGSKDVQLLAAVCLGYVFKGSAPDCPYDNETLKEVFPLIIESLRHLGGPNQVGFKRAHELLQTLAKYKILLLMLDLEGASEDFVPELFRVLLSYAINERNMYTIDADILEVLGVILDEFDSISAAEEEDNSLEIQTALLDEILRPLMPPQKDEKPSAYEVTKNLLHRAENKLQPYVQRFLMEVIDKGCADNSDLEGDHRDFIYEIYVAWPECMLAVLPRMADELQANLEETRLKAIDLLGRLLLVPGSTLASEYRGLFMEFMRRFSDLKPSVRLAILSWASTYLMVSSEGSHLAEVPAQICAAVHKLVLDFDDKVRLSACSTLCQLAVHNLDAVPMEYLQSVAQRLRDKKVPVRRGVLQHLAQVYRSQGLAIHGKGVTLTSTPSGLEWIPGKIVRCCADVDLRQHAVEPILHDELFSSKLSAEVCMQQWISTFAVMDEREKPSLAFLLRKKQQARQALRLYLDQRTVLREKGKKDKETLETIEKKCATAMRLLSDHFPIPSKALESMEKVHELKDGHIFKNLDKILDPAATVHELHTLKEDVLKRLGSKHEAAEFMKLLLIKVSLSTFNKEHVTSGFKLLKECVQNPKEDKKKAKPLVSAGFTLLNMLGAAFPLLFVDTFDDLQILLEDRELGPLREVVLGGTSSMLSCIVPGLAGDATAMKHVKKHEAKMAPLLAGLCPADSRELAKHAVRALCALAGPENAQSTGKAAKSASGVLTGLFDKLVVAMLKNGAPASSSEQTALVVAMQSIGEIAQLRPLLFETKADAVHSFGLKLLPNPATKKADQRADKKPTKAAQTSLCLVHTKALKMLVKSCLSESKDAEVCVRASAHAKQLLQVLYGLLTMEQRAIDVQLVLAAGSGILRLASKHDMLVTPPMFFQLTTVMQHTNPTVRAGVLRKMKKAFDQNQLGLKYAALLATAAVDPVKEYHQNAMAILTQVVQSFRARARAAQARHAKQKEGAEGAGSRALILSMPEYIFTYVIALLAHHPNFPAENNKKVKLEVYEPFQEMLDFVLQALTTGSGEKSECCAALPFIRKVLRYMKNTEDPLDSACTHKLYVLSDIALVLVTEISAANGWSIGNFPSTIPLPSSLFRALQSRETSLASEETQERRPSQKVRRGDGSYLPAHFRLTVRGFGSKTKGQGAEEEDDLSAVLSSRGTTEKAGGASSTALVLKQDPQGAGPSGLSKSAGGSKRNAAPMEESEEEEEEEDLPVPEEDMPEKEATPPPASSRSRRGKAPMGAPPVDAKRKRQEDVPEKATRARRGAVQEEAAALPAPQEITAKKGTGKKIAAAAAQEDAAAVPAPQEVTAKKGTGKKSAAAATPADATAATPAAAAANRNTPQTTRTPAAATHFSDAQMPTPCTGASAHVSSSMGAENTFSPLSPGIFTPPPMPILPSEIEEQLGTLSQGKAIGGGGRKNTAKDKQTTAYVSTKQAGKAAAKSTQKKPAAETAEKTSDKKKKAAPKGRKGPKTKVDELEFSGLENVQQAAPAAAKTPAKSPAKSPAKKPAKTPVKTPVKKPVKTPVVSTKKGAKATPAAKSPAPEHSRRKAAAKKVSTPVKSIPVKSSPGKQAVTPKGKQPPAAKQTKKQKEAEEAAAKKSASGRKRQRDEVEEEAASQKTPRGAKVQKTAAVTPAKANQPVSARKKKGKEEEEAAVGGRRKSNAAAGPSHEESPIANEGKRRGRSLGPPSSASTPLIAECPSKKGERGSKQKGVDEQPAGPAGESKRPKRGAPAVPVEAEEEPPRTHRSSRRR